MFTNEIESGTMFSGKIDVFKLENVYMSSGFPSEVLNYWYYR